MKSNYKLIKLYNRSYYIQCALHITAVSVTGMHLSVLVLDVICYFLVYSCKLIKYILVT